MVYYKQKPYFIFGTTWEFVNTDFDLKDWTVDTVEVDD